MLATIFHGPRDVRCEKVPEPKIVHPTDAIIRLSASCICGSDLWPYRGLNEVTGPQAMGHEDRGVVEEIGTAVTSSNLAAQRAGSNRRHGRSGRVDC